uniref:exodeoxyribonuclease III n=1 Tax=Cyprinus carpio TaxID=7962 RepID=A0A8C2CJE5_CYPCA
MESSKEQTLCFVSWNICGQKTPNIDQYSKELKAEIFFLQETRIGPESDMPLEKPKGWQSFFTVYDSKSKGVAILIKDGVPFQYISHDEDYSGGYVVLFCRLHGELFTLVNVYNHKDDKEMLYRLQEYLREAAEGVLVVGGDFNTVLDLSCDRTSKADTVHHTPQWGPFKKFTASLNLMDTWAYFHPTVKAFTYYQKDSYSRIDMFLLCEDNLERIKHVKIQEAKRTEDQIKSGKKETVQDHLLLLMCLKVKEVPNVASQLQKFHEPDRRAGKINGAEILSVIKSLTDSGHKGPNGKSVQTYKNSCCQFTEILKTCFNSFIKSYQLPPDFKASSSTSDGRKHFNVDYLIFTMVLAKRLNVLLEAFSEERSQKNTCDLCYCVKFAEKPKKIKWTFLKNSLLYLLEKCNKSKVEEKQSAEKTQNESQKKKKGKQKTSKKSKNINTLLKGLIPMETEERNMLEDIIPKASDDFRELQEGCPLTRSILGLVLKYLELRINEKYEKYTAHVCHSRQVVVIYENSSPDLKCLCEEFKINSGIELICFQLGNLQTCENPVHD